MTWSNDLKSLVKSENVNVRVFGVIIYTDEHAHIKRMLADDTYWKALDEISGKRLTVFATRALQGSKESQRIEGKLGRFQEVWKEPNENRELVDLFEIGSTETLPVLVVFAMEGDQRMQRTVVHLNDESAEGAFNVLRTVTRSIADAIEGVAQEYASDPLSYFRATEVALAEYKDTKFLSKVYDILKEIRDWLPFF